jgi:hypothetical protein
MASKQTVRSIRFVLLLALLALVQACQGAEPKDPTSISPTSSSKASARTLTSCSGDRFSIDLLDAISALPEDTLDAQREQLRDWVWTVTLARIAQRTSAEEVLSSVADEPLVRDDALAHVLHMQVGPTRAALTKSGGAIVMVEAADAATMDAEVAEAIDKQALHLGSTPADAQVYEYVFQPEVARAEVCAMKPLTRAQIESTARRYRSASITTAAELAAFLSGGVDLLSAQCTEAGLKVTGRQRPRNARAAFTVEHIAALSQARGTQYIPLARFGYSLDRLGNRAQLEANARKLDADAKNLDGRLAPIEKQPPDIQVLLTWKRQNPGVPTAELMMSLQLQREAYGRPGFSLDPHTSTSYATTLLNHLIDALPDIQKVAAMLRGLDEDERAEIFVDFAKTTNEPFAKEIKEALIAARGRLKKAKSNDEADAILTPIPGESIGSALAADLLQVVRKRSGQQCARYDGPLDGTATGMTFFYTDLLAKIWSLNWRGAAPEAVIEGFQSSIHPAGSTASCEDDSGQRTRMWFGVREEAFTREPSGAVHFAPMATRLFAKSSMLGKSQEESEPTAESKRFVEWWDTHFPQIAAWEPQYEVLNQLMKWSIAVQSSVASEDYACFAMLDQVAVQSSHRIDKWVAQTSDLRWRGPVELLPPPKGVKETSTDPECLSFLESEHYSSCDVDTRSLVGGVSAASLPMVAGKAAPTLGTLPVFRRLGAGSKSSAGDAGRVRFETVRGSGGELKNVSVESRAAQVKFSADVDTAASQRGGATSWDPKAPVKKFEKSLEIQGKELAGREAKNGLVNMELRSSDLDAASVKLEVKPSTVQLAKSDGQTLAKSMQLDGVTLPEASTRLARTRQVMRLDDGSVAVRFDGGESQPKTWAVMESGGGNRGPPPRGADVSLIVGTLDGGPHLPGSSQASRSSGVRVSILRDKAADAHITQRNGKPLNPSDPTLDVVKDKLQRGDIDSALKASEQNPSPWARQHLLEYALDKKDMKTASRVVDNAIQKRASASDLRALREPLANERVRIAREGGDLRELDGMTTKIAIAELRQLTSRKGYAAGNKGDSAVYAPTSYAKAADLPPSVHPVGKVLLPDEQYVTRVIREASPENLPAQIEVGGVKYDRRALGKPVSPSYSAVGSADRLFYPSMRPITVVLRCNDQNRDYPPCHELPSPEQAKANEEVRKCDLDQNYEISTSAERECLDAMRRKPAKPSPSPSP